ncbi:molybdopterin molybdotransferase MoeA [Cohnella thailandensis]|uniref:Molybdopterin molybdenumtransferase n=1 Tax=Cohnella thailandensis TaxID=557557 RepID=A0A841SMB2_9BACL|nr:molybdopterin molybdotransferase MoeA [Cohnella thailandensis]MBB6633613.1 molybdopterin molybdotransferase MoeA [Cohnella thailandensis]MBP1976397.1 molybdopterin molybdotransferase [Cohnella thailandensis]
MIEATEKTRNGVVSVEEAEGLLVSRALPPGKEVVELSQALGRTAAEAYVSPFSMPPFRRAAMDGYAVKTIDTLGASPEQPVLLFVESELKAGQSAEGVQGFSSERSAVRVFTGSPVPASFDSIIIQERVRRVIGEDGIGVAQIDRPAERGQHIAEPGKDIPECSLLLKQGKRIGPKEMALLASFGFERVSVHTKPTVAVLPIGEELVLPGQPLLPGRIYDSNGFMLEASLKEMGATVRRLPPCADREDEIARLIDQAWETADLVVTTGGVSVGRYDYAKPAAELAGAEPLFTKVLMRPGTPTSAYARGAKTLIALSGNPSACFAGLELLVKPYVRKAYGSDSYLNEWESGVLEEGVSKPCPYPRYIRSRVRPAGGAWSLTPLPNDRSGNIAAFSGAGALAMIPAGGQGAAAGQSVRWLRLT